MRPSQRRIKRYRRHRRVRAKVKGTADCPRFSVFRSHQHIYGQLVDDEKSQTLISASDLEIRIRKGKTKVTISKEVGKIMAQKALEKNIQKVVFDRGGYKYHGRVKAVAEGAREGGLKF